MPEGGSMTGDVACLLIVLAAVAVVGVILFLARNQGGEIRGGVGHGDLDVDPHTGVPYGAMDDDMGSW
jgi:hypothetical protein